MSRTKPEHPTEVQVFECAKALETFLKFDGVNYAFVGGLAVKIVGLQSNLNEMIDLLS